jgi:hypothetical protein
MLGTARTPIIGSASRCIYSVYVWSSQSTSCTRGTDSARRGTTLPDTHSNNYYTPDCLGMVLTQDSCPLTCYTYYRAAAQGMLAQLRWGSSGLLGLSDRPPSPWFRPPTGPATSGFGPPLHIHTAQWEYSRTNMLVTHRDAAGFLERPRIGKGL